MSMNQTKRDVKKQKKKLITSGKSLRRELKHGNWKERCPEDSKRGRDRYWYRLME